MRAALAAHDEVLRAAIERTRAGCSSTPATGCALRHCFQKVTGGMYMSGRTRGSLFAALKAAGVASILGWVLVLSAGPALADPDPDPGDPGVVAPPADSPAPPPLPVPAPPAPGLPPAPDPLAVPVVAGPAAGEDPTPFTGTAPFGPPQIAPANGSTVGVAQPIIIDFPGLVDDAGATESAIHVSRSRRFPASSTGRPPRSCAGAR
jgi:hypothetical protein